MIDGYMPKLEIDSLKVFRPIIQAGMGVGVSLSGLAAAASNQGCVGVISSVGIGMFESDFKTNYKEANKRALRKEIRKARSKTNGILGVNIMVAVSDFYDLLMTAIEEKIDVIFVGAGLWLKFPSVLKISELKNIKTKFVPIVSSARAAKIIFSHWDKNFGRIPDGVVVEGPLAGGHLGFKKNQIDDPKFSLEKLVPEVCSAIKEFKNKFIKKIPVIAAGGIYSGKDILKFLKLGAEGVQLGTRFVATNECDASKEFKELYLNCNKEDIVIIDSPVGLPGRAIKNSFIKDVLCGINKPVNCHWKCLKTCNYKKAQYCIANALFNAQKGIMKKGLAFVGSNGFKVNKLVPVKKLIDTLISEFEYSLSINTLSPI